MRTVEIGELQSWLEIIKDEPGIDYRTALVLITDENRSPCVNKGACGIAVADKPWLYFLFPPNAHQEYEEHPERFSGERFSGERFSEAET